MRQYSSICALRAAFIIIIALPGLGFVSGQADADPTGRCGYYTNSSGHQVPRPCGDWRSTDPTPPQGATRRCNDGTWSWSEHPSASGTCSYHGGVAR
jgi:hypothetical protein